MSLFIARYLFIYLLPLLFDPAKQCDGASGTLCEFDYYIAVYFRKIRIVNTK
jgi:hypothetical protein